MTKRTFIESSLLLGIAAHALQAQSAEKPEYVLADGRTVTWPEKSDVGGNAAFWVSKEEMRQLMVKAGYGDAKAARKIAHFWKMVIDEPKNAALWWIIAGILGDPLASHELMFSKHNGTFPEHEETVKTLVSALENFTKSVAFEEKKYLEEQRK